MSWLTKSFKSVADKVLDDVLGLDLGSSKPAVAGGPVIGPTQAEVLAADDRLRRAMAGQRGRSSSVVSGGLGTGGVRLAMPSLVGTG